MHKSYRKASIITDNDLRWSAYVTPEVPQTVAQNEILSLCEKWSKRRAVSCSSWTTCKLWSTKSSTFVPNWNRHDKLSLTLTLTPFTTTYDILITRGHFYQLPECSINTEYPTLSSHCISSHDCDLWKLRFCHIFTSYFLCSFVQCVFVSFPFVPCICSKKINEQWQMSYISRTGQQGTSVH